MKLGRYIGLSVLVLALLILGLVAFAQTWLRLGLKLYGIEDVSFEGFQIGLNQTELRGLKIGQPDNQSIDLIHLDYTPGALLGGHINQLTIVGLNIKANLDDLISSSPEQDPVSIPVGSFVDRFVLKESRLELETPIGPLIMPLSGQITTDNDQMAFKLNADRMHSGPSDNGVLAVLTVEGILPVNDEPLLDQLTASGQLLLQANDASLPEGAGGLHGEDLIAEGLITFDMKDGGIDASTDNLLIEVARLPFDTKPLPLPWKVNLGKPTHPLHVKGRNEDNLWRFALDGFLGLQAKLGRADTDLDLLIALDDEGHFQSLDRGLVALEIQDIAWKDTTLRNGKADLDLEGTKNALRGQLSLATNGVAWSDPPYTIDDVALSQDLSVAFDGQVLDLAVANEGRISVGRVHAVDQVESGWFTIRLRPGDGPLISLDIVEQSWRHQLDAEIDPVRLETPAGQWWARIEELTLVATGGAERPDIGDLVVKRGRADLPSANLALTGIESALQLTGDGLAADQTIPLTIRNIRPLDEPKSFSPLRLDAALAPSAPLLTFNGTFASKTKPAASLEFSGTHHLGRGEGRFDVTVPKLVFDPDGLEPADLSPALKDVMKDVSGQIALVGEVEWQKDSLRSTADLLIEELGLTIGPARLERVNTLLHFDNLTPLTTAAGQELAIGLLDMGLPLTDGLVSMQLGEDGRLAVDQLTWRFADGKVRAEPFTFGSDVQDLTMVLEVDQLDLNGLFALTRLDGLSGEGRLDGSIPLTITDAGVAIDNGKLEATGSGVLRYKPDEASGALQAGGESIGLLLQALENFRYDELHITLDGRTDGKTDIGLHIRGANPDLYDGHPIEFNLELEGNLANIIQTNLSNYQIPDRIREKLQGFGR